MSDKSDSSDIDDFDYLDEKFSNAADYVQRKHVNIIPNELLELYGLYKQATIGRCNTEKPGVLNMKSRSKWYAWYKLDDMNMKVAKEKYIEKVKTIDPNWLDEFEEKSGKSKNNVSWVVHSTEMPPIENAFKAECEKTIFDYVKDGDLTKLKEKFNIEKDLSALDENGMGLIHWATDRNYPNILNYLLAIGVDVNFRDAEQQTALHYAVTCGNLQCLRILIDANADRYAKDINGQTCYDVADSDEVRATLDL